MCVFIPPIVLRVDLLALQKMDDIFVKRGERFLALSILIKLPPSFTISNSFLLFELCRTCVELQNAGYLCPVLSEKFWMHQSLLFFMRYLAEYLDNQQHLGQKVLLPQDYLSATLRCLWYLQSSSQQVLFSSFSSLSLMFLQ